MLNEDTLDTAEIVNEAGNVVARYGRYRADDGSSWVRHGSYIAYHLNGQIASEVVYSHGLVEGLGRDFYDNGQLAAEGYYHRGKESGVWRFWKLDGTEQDSVHYIEGEEA